MVAAAVVVVLLLLFSLVLLLLSFLYVQLFNDASRYLYLAYACLWPCVYEPFFSCTI